MAPLFKFILLQVHPPMLEEEVVSPEAASSGEEEEVTRVDPCENHKCRRGRCKPRRKADGATDYKCRCRTGWSGRFCDQGETVWGAGSLGCLFLL